MSAPRAATAAIEACGRRFGCGGRVIRVARLAGDGYEFLDDPELAANGLRAAAARVDLLTFMPSVRDASRTHPYRSEPHHVAALPLRTFDEWWSRQVDSRVRNHVRAAAKKGVVAREVAFDDPLVHGISGLYNESPVRQGMRFTHYGKSLATVRAENGTFLDRAVFIGAFLDDTLVGFTKLVLDAGHAQAGVMQILAMIRHRDKSVVNALVADAVRWCTDRRVEHLVYSQFGLAQRDGHGLNEFKRANGFRPVDVPRYYIPLTILGRLALAARLHRRVADRIPEPIAVRLKALRAGWYTGRLPR